MRKFPNALVIMIGFILFSSLLTYVVPHGRYERSIDSKTNQEVVVPGSYQQVEAEPISVVQTMMAFPEGIISAADLFVLILLLGGCFYVIEKTGALKDGVLYLTVLLKGKEEIALIVVGLMFFVGGALNGLQEEVIAMTPVLLFFALRLGYNQFVAISISFGSAIIGAAFSPINPFAVVVAQNAAGLPLLSGTGYRLIILGLAFILWMFIVIRYANRNKIPKDESSTILSASIGVRSIIILGLLAFSFIILIYGMLSLDWGFNEMSAEFFALGIISGLVGNLGVNGTSLAYIEGFKEMTFAAVIMGLARSISLVLDQGVILDSIIYGLFLPLQYLPTNLSAVAMMISQSLLHFPVPSYSGQAVLTIPVLAPLSDLLGLSRQVCVLAYQYGAVTMDLIVPTNGALMAIIAIAGISFNKWFSFIIKPLLIMLMLGAGAIVLAVFIGY